MPETTREVMEEVVRVAWPRLSRRLVPLIKSEPPIFKLPVEVPILKVTFASEEEVLIVRIPIVPVEKTRPEPKSDVPVAVVYVRRPLTPRFVEVAEENVPVAKTKLEPKSDVPVAVVYVRRPLTPRFVEVAEENVPVAKTRPEPKSDVPVAEV